MTSAPSFPVRNLRFATNADVSRHWLGGQRAVTLFFDNLSLFFPPGERFFVAAVKHHQKRIADPRLAAEVEAFCGQEGYHSREHVRYNRMLEAQGYPAQRMEGRIERILRLVTRVLSPRLRLAVTCALEHFTATLAHVVLSEPALLAGAHPEMAALWRWHAAEEIEHKGVAYDVYQTVGGTYLERTAVMLAVTGLFWLLVIEQQLRLMRVDGIVGSAREWRSLFRFLWIEPGGLFTMWRLYLEYYRPSFHPWQLDDQQLISGWRRGLEPAQDLADQKAAGFV